MRLLVEFNSSIISDPSSFIRWLESSLNDWNNNIMKEAGVGMVVISNREIVN